MTEMANTVAALRDLPYGSVIRVESGDRRVQGEILEVVDREFHRYHGMNGAVYSTAWSSDLVPARVLWRPEYEPASMHEGTSDD